jgi:hypothetical protein
MKVLIACVLALLGLALASDMILTPGGYRPSHCVHILEEEGAIVEHKTFDQMFIKFANGTRKELPPCKEAAIASRQLQTGWVAYAVYNTMDTVTNFIGQWTVPPTPQSNDLQTVFLFTGLQNAYFDPKTKEFQGVAIIQPVLQWGPSAAGGGNYWTIASWYVGTNAVYSPLKKVQSNDAILGKMFLNKNNTWSIQCIDKTSGIDSNIVVETDTLEPFAFVTLEVYGMQSCQDYPNGKVRFSNLAVLDGSKPMQAQWQPVTIDQCNEAVTIVDTHTVDVMF